MGAKILGCSFCLKVTTTLSDQVVELHCEGSATNQNAPSSSLSRHSLIHEHPQELQRNSSSPVELQWNLNRAPVPMELKFSSGTPGNPLDISKNLFSPWRLGRRPHLIVTINQVHSEVFQNSDEIIVYSFLLFKLQIYYKGTFHQEFSLTVHWPSNPTRKTVYCPI